ncbi:hypothetical protein [Nonomuraea sediminis]|uniref:hypothetical protein n=1 Tax=Nonomuraea sediminis TaxID=2835864 RepID=UPI001BDD2340|nr:hypothetical protein [Nonomuraea sediminis]
MRSDLTYMHLAAVRDYLPELDRALVPSHVRRRWNQRELSPEQRIHMDAQAALDRKAKEINLALGIKALGSAPAPLNIAALDARDHITAAVAELEAAVCDRLAIIQLEYPTTAERISRIINLLDRIAAWEDLAEHVQQEALDLRRRARLPLGDIEPVVRLTARCLYCGSVSLRAFLERGTVVCANIACRCDDQDCPCSWEQPQRHIWPFDRWPWLAANLTEQIGVAAE